MENLNKIVYYAQAFANDLKYIYLHCMGKDFELIRALSKELWIELNDEIDEMSETFILNGVEIDNPSEIKSHLDFDSEWPATNNQIIQFQDFVQELKIKGTKYLMELESSELPKELKYLYVNFWRNRILFRNEKMMFPNNDLNRLGKNG